MALKKLKIAEYNFGHGPNFNLHTTLIFISLLVVEKTYFFILKFKSKKDLLMESE